jgi:hypothetical protein
MIIMFWHAFPAIEDFVNFATEFNLSARMLGTKELLGVELEITVVIQTFCRLLFNKTLCF